MIAREPIRRVDSRKKIRSIGPALDKIFTSGGGKLGFRF
jgi:hypothetical protein